VSARRGIVVAVDEKTAKVRVRFPDLDDMVSYWLPVVSAKTHKDKHYWLPDIGELVVVIPDEDGDYTQGYVLGAIYNSEDTTPVQDGDKHYIRYSDGTEVEYDRRNHILRINVPEGEVHITVQNGSGNVYINGNLIVSKEIYDWNQTKGSLDILRQTYNSHTHTGDSGGTTSTPNQTIP